MRLTIFLAIGNLALGLAAQAQLSTVVSGEYFFDSDPGFGAATALPAFSSGQNIDVAFLASTSGLTTGMHVLVVRVLDSDNQWSMPVYTPVYVVANDPLTIQNITAAEYFFDTEPGVGNATAVSVSSPAPAIDLNFAAGSAALSPGMHVLAVRTQNSLGEWSIPAYTPVYADRNRMISKLEYFFNTDPGVGNATQIDVDPDTDLLDQVFAMNSSALPPASHTLNVRVAGQNDFWGMTETVSFVICAAATPLFIPDVACAGSPTTFTDKSTIESGDTYQWDFDSDGKVDATTIGDEKYTYPAAGKHTATLTIDRGGCIATTTATVTVDEAAMATAGPGQTICQNGTAALIATVEGPVFTGTWTTSGDGVFDNDLIQNPVYTPGTADIGAGSVTLTYTTADPPGACTSVFTSTVLTITPGATVNAGADQNICGATPVTLAGSRGGASSTAVWSTAGDGVFDDVNVLNATYAPGSNDLASGTVDIHLTTDDPDGPCQEADDEMRIVFSTTPAVNAGADVAICGGSSTSLSGTAGGTATGYTWSTSGDGNFDDPAVLNASYTPGPNDIAAGSAVLTLTAAPVGTCLSQNDQLTATISKDIALAPQFANATIAKPVTVSVLAGGTFNPGDVLAATILTAPEKGTAQLQAGDVLRYVANTRTVGNDTVRVQVCNQCSQCDSEYFVFSIQNVPPVIDIPPAEAVAGGTLVISISSSVSDENGNINLSSAAIIQQPSSGASASIDINYNLVLDYSNVPNFNGTDNLTIEVCDALDACAQHVLTIEVGGDVLVHNAVAPNSTGDNRYMRIMNLPPGSTVTIYNRWGDKVFRIHDYQNEVAGNRFEGNNESGAALPTGIYFFRIEIPDSPGFKGQSLTGYLALKQ